MTNLSTHKPAIVVPAHKRYNSLQRLLDSINEANFPNEKVQLIISIDGNSDPRVVSVANKFSFKGGDVQVVEQKKNIGLYHHIMKCADYSQKFGSVIILEDDLVVGPAFYEYAQKALSFYDEDESISGIALYSQRFNETAGLPFEALKCEWPVYFMQLGCSWGQAWTNKQWNNFKNWKSGKKLNSSKTSPEVPENIQKWPATSWKKHFNQYLVDQNKYMVYPYESFTTNCTDSKGVHINYLHNTFQVPLNLGKEIGSHFQFPAFTKNVTRYDCFMESESKIIEDWSGISLNALEVDLYGHKPVELLQKKKYAITSKKGRYPLRSFPLTFRPIELNVKYGTKKVMDSTLKLYKTKDLTIENSLSKSSYYQLAEYFLYIPIESNRFAWIYFLEFLKKNMKKLKDFFSYQ